MDEWHDERPGRGSSERGVAAMMWAQVDATGAMHGSAKDAALDECAGIGLLRLSFNLTARLGKSEAKGNIGVIAKVAKILKIDGR